MAESDQIRDKDLFQPDITAKAIADFEKLINILDAAESKVKSFAATTAKSLSASGTPSSVDDIQSQIKSINDLKSADATLTEIQKQQLVVYKEKLRLRAEQKTYDKEAKQRAKEEADAIKANAKSAKESAAVFIAAEKEKAAALKASEEAQKKANAPSREQVQISKLQEQATKSATGSYNQLSAQYRLALIELKKLSKEERDNTIAGKQLTAQVADYQAKLTQLDAKVGTHTRNVGNYSGALVKLQRGLGGLAGLGATIAQMFGVDTTQVQFLVDASHELIKTSKELTHTNELSELAHEKLTASQTAEAAATTTNTAAAEAQTVANEELTTSTEAQTVANEALEASNPFGWVALAIAGIAALSIGIYEWTKTESDAEIAAQGLKDTMSDFNTAAATAIEEVDKVKASFQEAKDGVISKDQALKNYNTTLGGTLGAAKDLNEAEQIMRDKVPDYIKAVALKAQADALFKKAAQDEADAISAQLTDQRSNVEKYFDAWKTGFGLFESAADAQKDAADGITKAKTKEAGVFDQLATKMLEEADALDKANGITETKTLPVTKEVTKALTDQDDALQKLLSDWQDARNSPIQSTLGALDEQTGDDIRKQLKDNLDEYKNNEDAKLDYLKVDLDKGLISQKDYDQKVYEEKKAALQQQINELKPLIDELDPTSAYYNPEIAAKFTSEQTSEIKKDYADLLAELGDLNAGYADNAKATFKSVFTDMTDGMKEVIQSFEMLNKNKYDALDKELQREATLINDQTKVQEDLFKDGFDNTLSYQQKKLAENYEQQAKIAKKKHKQEEADQLAEVFLELLKANPNNPGKALAETLIAKSISLAISGSYKEGTADTGGNGSGVDGEGGMYAVVHPHEAVIPADKNAAMPGLAQAWIDGEVDDYFREIYLPLRASSLHREDMQGARQSTDYKLMLMLNKRMLSIEKTIKEKPETDLIGYHRKYDEMVFQRKERGITQEIHFKPRGK